MLIETKTSNTERRNLNCDGRENKNKKEPWSKQNLSKETTPASQTHASIPMSMQES